MKKLLFILFLLPILVLGQGRYSVSNSAHLAESSYTANYQAYYDEMTDPPGTDTAGWQNDMFYSLDSAGCWDGPNFSIDVMYLLAQKNEQSALLECVDPGGDFDGVATNSPTFDSYEGYTGNGSNAYIATSFNFSTDATYFSQNDASMVVYVRTNVAEDNSIVGGDGGGNLYFRPQIGNTTSNGRINGGTIGCGTASCGGPGYWAIARTASDAQALYRDDALSATDTDASSAVPNENLVFLRGRGTEYSTNQASLIIVGGGITETYSDIVYAIIQRYMTRIGKEI